MIRIRRTNKGVSSSDAAFNAYQEMLRGNLIADRGSSFDEGSGQLVMMLPARATVGLFGR